MDFDRWDIPSELKKQMIDAARRFRKEPTPTEDLLWDKLRRKGLGHKFKRQVPIGPFVVDFLCPSSRLVVEVDGPIHQSQQQADQDRQALIETLGLRFVRVTSHEVKKHLPEVLDKIRNALNP